MPKDKKKKKDEHEGHDHGLLEDLFKEYTLLAQGRPDVEQFKHYAMLRGVGVKVIAHAKLTVQITDEQNTRLITMGSIGGVSAGSPEHPDLKTPVTDAELMEGIRGLLLQLQMEFNEEIAARRHEPMEVGDHHERRKLMPIPLTSTDKPKH